ncbi:ArsR family transcriptional regulator [Nocardioides sp. TF02-7]|uniref:ArsR/SmtB family transcription factor n=1 Tax=Nocardioides sp. TF02-7 TaxID=2917724 RepID=UPI0031F4D9CB
MTSPTVSLPLVDTGVCCSPVTGGALDAEEAQRLARMFKALGDPTRVRLLSLIAAQPEREACICDLVDPVGLAQPTVSPPHEAARRRRPGGARAARPLGLLPHGRGHADRAQRGVAALRCSTATVGNRCAARFVEPDTMRKKKPRPATATRPRHDADVVGAGGR